MKLPTLWIAAAFVSGIALASRWPRTPLKLWLGITIFALLAGAILFWQKRALVAWAAVLLAWAALGGLAITIEHAAVPANHVTRLITQGRIDTSEPLRWRGRLREDPKDLPWGRRYEIDLEQVEAAGKILSTSGGLRLNLYPDRNSHAAKQETLRAGDRVEALVRAKPPRNFLDPGAFDFHGYLARQKIDLIGSLRSRELLQLIDRPRPTFAQRLARVRGGLLTRLDSLFTGAPERAAILRAMLLGDRSFVESDVVTTFQKTGAYHVLVVAGLHVGALAVFLFWLCRRLRFSITATSFVTLAGLAAYLGIVQDRPPILRASLMAALYLCAKPLFRRVELLNTIAVAGLAILLWKPSLIADSGFQLSFLAAGVIAGLALPWMDRTSAPYRAGLRHLGDATRDVTFPPKITQFRIEMRAATEWLAARLPQRISHHADVILGTPLRIGLRLWEVALLSLVIQWGMMPLLARDFHRVTLAGPLSNIPAVILTGWIVPIGFLTLAMSFLWTRVAVLLAKLTSLLAGWLLASVTWFSYWPRFSYRIPNPPMWLIATFLAVFIVLAAAARAAAIRQKDRIARRQLPPRIHPAEWISALVLAGFTIAIAIHPFAPQLERGKLEVSVLDVGQGDSIFVAFPDGRTMLIDGGGASGSEWVGGYRAGPDVGEEVVSPYLWSRGLKHLDVVALTHAHHDHIDGLHSVLQNFRVRELWIGRDEETKALQSLIEEARTQGVSIVHEMRGGQFNWDGIEGKVLWPADPSPVTEASNDNSMVLRLTDGSVRFLLAGDVEKKSEKQMVNEQANGQAPLAADFLKVPHHGSKTSSTDDFLAAVAPRVAVVSAGEGNPFGHPAESTVERYERASIRLLRTDRDGVVTALTDGTQLTLRTFADSHPH